MVPNKLTLAKPATIPDLTVSTAAACPIARACAEELMMAAAKLATALAEQARFALLIKDAWTKPVQKFAWADADNTALANAATAAAARFATRAPINV
jgi:hypothetical protein